MGLREAALWGTVLLLLLGPDWLEGARGGPLRRRRAVEPGCGELRGVEPILGNNTYQYIFDDFSGTVSLSWVGDSTGVILVLTTFKLPLLFVSFKQSKLYRSEDYGKTFIDITKLINHTFIRTELGMAIGPENSGKAGFHHKQMSGHTQYVKGAVDGQGLVSSIRDAYEGCQLEKAATK